MNVQQVDLERISIDQTQTRAALRQHAVDEYAALISSGEEMEPAVVFDDGEKLHLSAGFHRRKAYEQARKTKMPCEVRTGTVWDAIEFGIQDNLKHRGERLSNADRAHNIRLVLKTNVKLSNSAIAQLCGSTDKTVAKYRLELEMTSEIPRSDSRLGRDGRTIRTTTIEPISDGRTPAVETAERHPTRSNGVVPADWSPREWSESTVETRREYCRSWWDGLAPWVLLLNGVGWDTAKIADFFAVRREDDVESILNPRPPERDIAEFEAISHKPQQLMAAYRDVVGHAIHFLLGHRCTLAQWHADKEDLPEIARSLSAQAEEHNHLAKSLRPTVWPGSHAESIKQDCIATDCCATQDARLALGIELREEFIGRTRKPLIVNYAFFKASPDSVSD